jgi:hypothetical protein
MFHGEQAHVGGGPADRSAVDGEFGVRRRYREPDDTVPGLERDREAIFLTGFEGHLSL